MAAPTFHRAFRAACAAVGSAAVSLSWPACAQETSRDRAELDAAAGRALFQPTSLYDSVAPTEAPIPAPTRQATAQRRPIRVVYPRSGDR